MALHGCNEYPCPICTNQPITKANVNLFEQINEKKMELDRIIKEFGEQAIKEYLREFWVANPGVESIKWHQYTPYFNDGDVCEFNVYDVYAKLVGADPEGGDYEDGYQDSWSLKYDYRDKEMPSEVTAILKLNEIWQSNEIALQAVFGDHVQITADRDKIEAEEYSHD